MKKREIRRIYKSIHRTAFPHIKRPCLLVWGEIAGVYVGTGNVILLIRPQHGCDGEIIDTLLHELCHAEQKADKVDVEDNADHLRRVKAAWRRLF